MEERLTQGERDRLLLENNQMLKYIIAYLKHKHNDFEDFLINLTANVFGN